VVTVAYSTDLTHWMGAGYIDATRRFPDGVGGQTTGGQAENPCVMWRDGTYYLLFSDWQDPEDHCSETSPRTIVQFATSPSLTADASGSSQWIYRGYTADPGVNASEVQRLETGTWLISQSVSNSNTFDHAVHRRDLRLKLVVWGPDCTFSTAPWHGTFRQR
jgi:hypothetical protein